jgi:hypothetical protein
VGQLHVDGAGQVGGQSGAGLFACLLTGWGHRSPPRRGGRLMVAAGWVRRRSAGPVTVSRLGPGPAGDAVAVVGLDLDAAGRSLRSGRAVRRARC